MVGNLEKEKMMSVKKKVVITNEDFKRLAKLTCKMRAYLQEVRLDGFNKFSRKQLKLKRSYKPNLAIETYNVSRSSNNSTMRLDIGYFDPYDIFVLMIGMEVKNADNRHKRKETLSFTSCFDEFEELMVKADELVELLISEEINKSEVEKKKRVELELADLHRKIKEVEKDYN